MVSLYDALYDTLYDNKNDFHRLKISCMMKKWHPGTGREAWYDRHAMALHLSDWTSAV